MEAEGKGIKAVLDGSQHPAIKGPVPKAGEK
jgi:hypothetical protein